MCWCWLKSRLLRGLAYFSDYFIKEGVASVNSRCEITEIHEIPLPPIFMGTAKWLGTGQSDPEMRQWFILHFARSPARFVLLLHLIWPFHPLFHDACYFMMAFLPLPIQVINSTPSSPHPRCLWKCASTRRDLRTSACLEVRMLFPFAIYPLP